MIRSDARRRASSAAASAVVRSGYPMAIRSAMVFPFLVHLGSAFPPLVMRRTLILSPARGGVLTLPWVNCGDCPVPAQPFGVGLAVVHVKFHIAGRGLGEHQRGGARQRAAEQVSRTGRLESQGPPGLTARADFGEFHSAFRAR